MPGVRALLEICNQAPVDTILLSGRDGKYSWEMLTWLGKNGLHVDKFFMRTAGDQRKDDVIKREIYETLIAPFWDVILVVDDRESVCAMWRELGLPLIQVKDPGIVPPIAALAPICSDCGRPSDGPPCKNGDSVERRNVQVPDVWHQEGGET